MLNKRAAEVRTFSVDFTDELIADEVLSGTPTATEGTGALTISGEALSVSPVAPMGRIFIPTARGVQFTVAGGTAGSTYTIVVTAATSAQTLIRHVRLRVN